MKFTYKASGVPVGIYTAIFTSIEDVPANVEKGYKAAFKFTFKILAGEYKGAEATRIPGGSYPSDRNGLGKFFASMTGVPFGNGIDIDVESMLGQKFNLVVEKSKNGGTRVEEATPVK